MQGHSGFFKPAHAALTFLGFTAIAAGIPAEILPPPREWIAVERLPRQSSGKLDLRSLERRLSVGEANRPAR